MTAGTDGSRAFGVVDLLQVYDALHEQYQIARIVRGSVHVLLSNWLVCISVNYCAADVQRELVRLSGSVRRKTDYVTSHDWRQAR